MSEPTLDELIEWLDILHQDYPDDRPYHKATISALERLKKIENRCEHHAAYLRCWKCDNKINDLYPMEYK